MSYDFDIVYKKMITNIAADALLKVYSQELTCMALSSISPILFQQILDLYEKDPDCKR